MFLHRHRVPDVLHGLPFDEKTAALFDGRISVIAVPAGEYICRQGRAGVEIIWILEGAADVVRNGEVIAHVGAGTVVGEINATHLRPFQTADVVTTVPSVLGVQNLREWHSVARQSPEVSQYVATLAERRLHSQAA